MSHEMISGMEQYEPDRDSLEMLEELTEPSPQDVSHLEIGQAKNDTDPGSGSNYSTTPGTKSEEQNDHTAMTRHGNQFGISANLSIQYFNHVLLSERFPTGSNMPTYFNCSEPIKLLTSSNYSLSPFTGSLPSGDSLRISLNNPKPNGSGSSELNGKCSTLDEIDEMVSSSNSPSLFNFVPGLEPRFTSNSRESQPKAILSISKSDSANKTQDDGNPQPSSVSSGQTSYLSSKSSIDNASILNSRNHLNSAYYQRQTSIEENNKCRSNQPISEVQLPTVLRKLPADGFVRELPSSTNSIDIVLGQFQQIEEASSSNSAQLSERDESMALTIFDKNILDPTVTEQSFFLRPVATPNTRNVTHPKSSDWGKDNESGNSSRSHEPQINLVSNVRAIETDPEKPDNSLHKSKFGKNKKKSKILLIMIGMLIGIILLGVPSGVVLFLQDKRNGSSNVVITDNNLASNLSSTASDSTVQITSLIFPDNLRKTIYDVSTWKDTIGFNTTYTDAKVGGLSLMGLNSSWDNSARANSLVPSLEEKFKYGEIPIRGVNLGGWLVLEPFITPSFFSNYDIELGIVDEWTLIEYLNSTQGYDAVVEMMETHYSTFVTEDTFREIQEAGLDHVRIPVGYWAVKTWKDDGFLPQISWRYLLRGIEWARKYGIRVNLDLHCVPGGQNGWNHSGRQGVLNWMQGKLGLLYGERAIEIHSAMGEFFAQDRYSNLVTIYGLANEPNMIDLDVEKVNKWIETAYQVVRDKGYNGIIAFGDGFRGVDSWKDTFPNHEFPNMALDIHEYTIFDPSLIHITHSAKIDYVCREWVDQIKISSSNITGHGPTFIGEWSQADNDCTVYVNSVGSGSRWEGDVEKKTEGSIMTCAGNQTCSCSASNADPSSYSDMYKQFLLNFAEVQMEVFESSGSWGSMYWTWDTETLESSQWSYKKARNAGTMPQVAYNRTYSCNMPTPDYGALGLSESY